MASLLMLGELEIIGRGKNSTVYAWAAPNKDTLAVKIAAKRHPLSSSWRMLENELELLPGLEHPNILAFLVEPLELAASPIDEPRLFTRRYDCTLEELLIGSKKNPKPLQPLLSHSVRVGFAQQLLAALAYLEKSKVCHLDVKPENFLVNLAGNHTVLSDFGFAKQLQGNLIVAGKCGGSPLWMSPERFLGKPFGPPADLYAGALTIWGVLTGERIFPEFKAYHKLKEAVAILWLRPPKPSAEECSAAWWWLLTECWANDPDGRPTAANAYAQSLCMAI